MKTKLYFNRSKDVKMPIKDKMADALLELMQTTSFEKITADSIAAKAGVGRATWFRNFNSKNEAITYKLVQLWTNWTKANNIDQQGRYSLYIAKDFFKFNYEIRGIHDLIYSEGLQAALYDAFCQVMLPHSPVEAEDCYESKVYSYGLFGLLDEWIKRHYMGSPEEMAEKFLSLLGKTRTVPVL